MKLKKKVYKKDSMCFGRNCVIYTYIPYFNQQCNDVVALVLVLNPLYCTFLPDANDPIERFLVIKQLYPVVIEHCYTLCSGGYEQNFLRFITY